MLNKSRIILVSLFVSLWSCVSIAEVEEVVVTALKRDQSLQDVPISVSALTSNDLDGLSLSDTADITQQIPNFQVNAWSPNLTTFNIRGISQNNFVDVNEAPIAVYMDDIYMGTMNGISTQLFDIERVEVLRGPQGTLFGRNATGGLVHYVSRGADRDDFNVGLTTGFGSFAQQSSELTIGSHLGDPRYRHRFAFRQDISDGYVEPGAAGDVTAAAKPRGYLGGRDYLALRYALQFDFSETVRMDVNYKFSRDPRVPTGGYVFLPLGDSSTSHIPPEWFPVARSPMFLNDPNATDAAAEMFLRNAFFTGHPDGTKTGAGGEMVNTTLRYDGKAMTDGFAPISNEGLTTFEGDSPNPHTHYANYEGYLNRTTSGFDIKLHYNDEYDNSFTYIGGFYRLNKYYTEDGDGLPAFIINFTTLMDYEQISQEFRFSKETEAGHHYQAGLYWMSLDHSGGSITEGAPALGAVGAAIMDPVLEKGPQANQSFYQDTTNVSLFGETDLELNNTLRLIVGARMTLDNKSINYRRFLRYDGVEITDPASVFTAQAEFEQPDVVGRLILSAALGAEDQHNVFFSINRGLKSGGFNVSSNVTRDNLEYDAESLVSLELGYKADFTDSLRFSATIYDYDYEDYQAFSIFGGTPNISNADATAQGLELDLKWAPGQFLFSFGMGYGSSDVDGIQGIGSQVPPGGLPTVTIPVNTLNNKELPNLPDLSFNFLLSYDLLIGSSSSWLFQIDGAWYGDQYLEVTNGAGSFQEAYMVLNFATVWRSSFGREGAHGIEAKFYMKNIADTEYKLYNLDLGLLGSTAYYAPPTSFGVTLAYNFN